MPQQRGPTQFPVTIIIMQAPLFQDNPDSFESIDLGDVQVHLHTSAFEPSDASAMLQNLAEDIPWRQDSLWIAGREIPVPRLQCWMGDAGSLYGYSGMRLEPEPWHRQVQAIRSRVQELSGIQFNSVLLNLYRNGEDSVSWHADDEPELGRDPVIASVSLGAVRRFQLKHRHDRLREKLQIDLPHGSILIMGKGMQNKWLHQVPKQKTINEPRINLTFRQIIRRAAA